jgi:MFS family permease
MSLSFRLPHYFSLHLRRQVKELYVATAISDMAVAAMLIFEPIYLKYELGLSVPWVILFFAGVYAWYIVLIPFGGKFAARFGYKHSMILSVPFQLAYWTCLFFASRYTELLYVATLLYGLQKSFYWPAFHAVVARFANKSQVGREFSVLTAVIQTAHIFGPLVGGFLAARGGGGVLLVVAGCIYSLMIIPLLAHKERGSLTPYKFKDTLNLYRRHTDKALGYFGFGEEFIALGVWPIFIYEVLKGYDGVGVMTTVSSGLAIVISLWMGRLTDQSEKRLLIKRGGLLAAISWFVRPFLLNAGGVLVSDTFGRTAKNAVSIPMCTVTYERAEASDIMPYMVFFEQSLAIGKLLTALLAALLFATTGSFVLLFILAGILSFLYMLL